MADAKRTEREAGHDIGERLENFLGEFRLTVPALAALFGFQLIVAFQDSFARLPAADRAANFVGVACTAAAILFLLVPASYHRFTARLEETEAFLEFARRSISIAFVFIPLAIGFALYMQALRAFGSHGVAAAVAVCTVGVLVLGWWVVPHARARSRGRLVRQQRERP